MLSIEAPVKMNYLLSKVLQTDVPRETTLSGTGDYTLEGSVSI